MNRLTKSLAHACREFLFEEKTIITPSLRVGHQWLDAVARGGQAVINAHTLTLKGFVLRLASEEMTRRGARFVSGMMGEVITDRVWRRVCETHGKGYMTALAPSMESASALHRTLRDLRLAGLSAADLTADRFEVRIKARELAAALDAYGHALDTLHFIDYAEALRLATINLKSNPGAFAHNRLILIPDDTEWAALERQLLAAIPHDKKIILATDKVWNAADPASAPAPDTNLALLRYLLKPVEAPPPFSGATVRFFRAVGRINEAREVFRRCLAERIPLDQVELLYTESGAYLPLIYEELRRLESRDHGNAWDATFAEGIPVSFTRPGRALTAWIEWMTRGFPQKKLVNILWDGLLSIPQNSDALGPAQLAAALQSLPIGLGRERYLKIINSNNPQSAIRNSQTLETLKQLLAGLLAVTPDAHHSQTKILDCAQRFVESVAYSHDEIDNNARHYLLASIRGLKKCLAAEDAPSSLDVREWLGALPSTLPVLGSGPRPGCLHVAPLNIGGHSGRAFTFIIGLDDTLFPGVAMQDPLLLDSERRQLSDDLQGAARGKKYR